MSATWPTATQKTGDVQDTPTSTALVAVDGIGGERVDQAWPSHISASGTAVLSPFPPELMKPTATQASAVGHDNPLSPLGNAPNPLWRGLP
jgi:hypothetical protein